MPFLYPVVHQASRWCISEATFGLYVDSLSFQWNIIGISGSINFALVMFAIWLPSLPSLSPKYLPKQLQPLLSGLSSLIFELLRGDPIDTAWSIGVWFSRYLPIVCVQLFSLLSISWRARSPRKSLCIPVRMTINSHRTLVIFICNHSACPWVVVWLLGETSALFGDYWSVYCVQRRSLFFRIETWVDGMLNHFSTRIFDFPWLEGGIYLLFISLMEVAWSVPFHGRRAISTGVGGYLRSHTLSWGMILKVYSRSQFVSREKGRTSASVRWE